MSKYLVSLPQSQRAQYLENDNGDFLLDFVGYTLKSNSVKLTGTLVVSTTAPPTLTPIGGANILMDGVTGIDSCFQSFTTSISDIVVENNPEYPRFQKMNLCASNSRTQLVGSAFNTMALRCYSDELTTTNLVGPNNDGRSQFCTKPNICLNNSQGLNGDGQVRLSVRLASVNNVLFGTAVNATTSYWLENLRVEYEVMPQTQQSGGVMVTNHCLKQTINNGNANLSFIVPVPSSKISCSMIQTANLSRTDYNHLTLEKPDTVSRVELSINDGTSQVVSYPLETEQEILEEYLRSLGNYKHNCNRINDLLANEKFGFGYSYTTMLSGAKIGLQIVSSLNAPYAVYSYFSSVNTL